MSTHCSTSSSAIGVTRISGNGVAQLARERASVAFARSDDEARVVPGERADDPLVAELVQRSPDRGLDDDDVPGGRDATAELGEDPTERLSRIRAARVPRRVVARPSERVVRLLESQLADVARDRCLRDDAAGVGERVDQLELGPHAFPCDDALDQTVPLGLPEYSTGLHR